MEKLNGMLHGATMLSKREMKNVVGGKDLKKEIEVGDSPSGWCYFRDGEAVLTGCTTDAQCVKWYGEGTCK